MPPNSTSVESLALHLLAEGTFLDRFSFWIRITKSLAGGTLDSLVGKLALDSICSEVRLLQDFWPFANIVTFHFFEVVP